jgi:hypothetical protein
LNSLFRPCHQPVLLELKSKAQAAADSFRNGTWARPTEADPQLFPGLGGSKAILQHTRQQPAHSPAASDESNVMISLERVQPTLDDYIRSFDRHSDLSGAQAPMAVPSSDAFLHGALTGDWGSFPTMEAPLSDLSGSFLGPSTSNEGSQPSPSHQPYIPSLTQSLSSFSHSPFSDGASSGSSAGQALFDNPQPFHATLQPPTTLFTSVPTVVQPHSDPEGQVLWDNFLRELGIQSGTR